MSSSKHRIGPQGEKPTVWIEGEFSVASPGRKLGAQAPVGRKASQGVLGFHRGLAELVFRLLAVATGCAFTLVLMLIWVTQTL